MEPILKTTMLQKKYGSFTAVDDVDLRIDKGEIYGLVGRNGAGKTTLMKMITGLTYPTDGEIELFGDKENLAVQRRRIGCIVETPEFFPYFNARDNLEYFRRQRGVSDRKKVDEVLELVDLADTGKKKFKTFSLGMKQRMGLALTLLTAPDLLILDEPINGIDPEGIVELRRLLVRLATERGVAIMISSHILGELANLATRFAFMEAGRLVEQITADELQSKTTAYLELQVDQPERCAALLEEQLGIREYRHEQGNKFLIFVNPERSSEITSMLVRSNIAVQYIHPCHSSLESYFLSLVGSNVETKEGLSHV